MPLVERRKIAREKHGADVFVSIHADAFTDARAHGASVFALSNRGATSARARYLAKIANESDRVAGVYEEEEDDSSLYSVLADLQMNGSMAGSLYLGRQVLLEMGKVTKLHGGRDKVEQAGFAVLKEPEMVSILVETGFISNPTEERNLRSSAHQTKLARSVLNGIDAYFVATRRPIAGTPPSGASGAMSIVFSPVIHCRKSRNNTVFPSSRSVRPMASMATASGLARC